jgi:hypothetical protein
MVVLALVLSACGSGGGPSLETRFEQVESCTGLSAPVPNVRVEPVVACPTSHRMCCLESVSFFDCPEGRCGATGKYERETGTIVLPKGCSAGFEHESVHHLLFHATADPDVAHRSPLFRECGNG